MQAKLDRTDMKIMSENSEETVQQNIRIINETIEEYRKLKLNIKIEQFRVMELQIQTLLAKIRDPAQLPNIAQLRKEAMIIVYNPKEYDRCLRQKQAQVQAAAQRQIQRFEKVQSDVQEDFVDIGEEMARFRADMEFYAADVVKVKFMQLAVEIEQNIAARAK